MKKLVVCFVLSSMLVFSLPVRADLFLGFGYRPPCAACRPIPIYPQHYNNYYQYNYKSEFYSRENNFYQNERQRSHELDRNIDRSYHNRENHFDSNKSPRFRGAPYEPRNIIINNYYN